MAAAALGEQSVASILGLTLALGEQCEVGSGLGLLLEAGVRLELLEVTLALEHLRGDQTLDLWGLGVLLAALGGDLPADDTLADVIILVHTPELADLVGPLGSEAEVLVGISEAWNIGGATLDDNQVQHGQILVDDAATDRLALTLTSPALTVALGALHEEKADAVVSEDTLEHWESLLVVTAGD